MYIIQTKVFRSTFVLCYSMPCNKLNSKSTGPISTKQDQSKRYLLKHIFCGTTLSLLIFPFYTYLPFGWQFSTTASIHRLLKTQKTDMIWCVFGDECTSQVTSYFNPMNKHNTFSLWVTWRSAAFGSYP